MTKPITLLTCGILISLGACAAPLQPTPQWQSLTLDDFENVNGSDTTWTQRDDVIVCSGIPNGGARLIAPVTNFELELDWKHHVYGGNAGVFLWCPESAFTDLPPGALPRSGIEVQVLDLGYEENWFNQHGKQSDWFTSHGDVFPVGASTMTATTPQITYTYADGSTAVVGNPKSSRSFPTQRLTNGVGEWNHYRILAVDGHVTLWVKGLHFKRATINCDITPVVPAAHVVLKPRANRTRSFKASTTTASNHVSGTVLFDDLAFC
jgi:hypothetical protein